MKAVSDSIRSRSVSPGNAGHVGAQRRRTLASYCENRWAACIRSVVDPATRVDFAVDEEDYVLGIFLCSSLYHLIVH